MINHKYKFIFVRVAKTGSSSILETLPKSTTNCEGWKYDCHHIPLWHLKKNLDKDIFNNYFKFAFVRNPFARAVSTMKYINTWKKWNGFDDYLNLKESLLLKNEKEQSKYSNQYDFTKGCDFIGKLESIQEDFNTVCDKIGVSRQQLPHYNTTKHRHYTEYYDDETLKIAEEKFAKDIEHFGYKFGE